MTPLGFASYVQARRPVLMRTARSLAADPHDAEDLLQTALTKTYIAWDRIADHRAVDGYVRRTLVNTRTSQWRKRRVDEFVTNELPEPEPLPAADPGEQQAVRDAMWQAVLRLPARQRAMVVLRYYEDLSEVRTAEVLGVSVGTVKSAVSRALTKLREDVALGESIVSESAPSRRVASDPAASASSASSASGPALPGPALSEVAPAGGVAATGSVVRPLITAPAVKGQPLAA